MASSNRLPDDTEHERSLRAVDPRGAMSQYQPRMVLLSDEPESLAELGTLQDEFIQPSGK